MANESLQSSALFFLSVGLGFLYGLYFEVFRFLRLALPHPALAVNLEDLLFFLPVTFVTVIFNFCFSDGIIRWFTVAGLLFGFWLYRKTLGRLLLFFSNQILCAIRAFLRLIYRRILSPIGHLFMKIFRFLFTRAKRFVILIQRFLIKRKNKKIRRRILIRAEKGFRK